MARILLTGNLGFVGRRLSAALAKARHAITNYDIGYRFPLDQKFDGIIHLAAVSRVSDAENKPIRAVDANVVLTAKLLEVQCKWFILASTQEKPVNVYGLTKRFAEDYAQLRCEAQGITLLILRLCNIYGPGDNPRRLMPRLAAGEKLNVRNDLFPFAYAHVDDVVLEIMQAVDGGVKRGIISVQSDTAANVEELRRVAATN